MKIAKDSKKKSGILISSMVVFLFFIFIAIVILYGYSSVEQNTKDIVKVQLNNTLESNIKALDSWIKDKKLDARVLANNAEVLKKIFSLLKKIKELPKINLKETNELAWLRENLGKSCRQYGFVGFVLLDKTGLQIAALLDDPVGEKKLMGYSDFFSRSIKGETVVSLPFLSETPLPDKLGEWTESVPTMFTATPIFKDGRVAAVLAFRLRPEKGFSNVFNLGRMGVTGESYAFNSNGQLLSSSRFDSHLKKIGLISQNDKNGILKFRIKDPGVNLLRTTEGKKPREHLPLTVMARSAIQGHRGVNLDGYRDYRGVEVVGSWVWLNDLGLGVATEIDTSEIFEPLSTLKFYYWELIIIIFLVFIVSAILWFKQLAQRENIEKKIKISNLLKDISEASNQAESPRDALQVVLHYICEFNHWSVGHIFEMAEDGEHLISTDIFYARFPSEVQQFIEKTRKTTFAHGEGLPGRVWESKHAELIRDIQEIPECDRAHSQDDKHLKSAMGFPILLNGKIFAVQEFFSDRIEPPLSEETKDLMNLIGIQLGFVFERQIAEDRIQKAREAAERANNAKSVFLANMSHEIRTPMNAILGYSQIMNSSDEIPRKFRKAVKSINSSGNHLLDLINDVLDLSKIESGMMVLNEEDFNLGYLIADIVDMFEMKCKTKNIYFRTHYPSALSEMDLHGDRVKLRQALINLIGNAVKFTNEGGVDLTINRPDKNLFEFEISDTGLGIPEDEQELIFLPFRQSHHNKSEGGTGLGLSICKKQIELMGGEISINSKLNKGSQFKISLTLCPANGSVDHKDLNERVVLKPLTQDKAPKVLVVDDVKENREVLLHVLDNVGFVTEAATDGREAMVKVETFVPDLIFMDNRLPNLKGSEVVKKLIGEKNFKGKIVGISASVVGNESDTIMKSGCDWIIQKPFKIEEIYNCLSELLKLEIVVQPKPVMGEKSQGSDGISKEIELPKELVTEMRNVADAGDISGLEALLLQVETYSENGKQFAGMLQRKIEDLELDEISEILEEISCR